MDLKKNLPEDYSMIEASHYSLFSALFRYPVEGYQNDVRECMNLLETYYPDAAVEMKRFVDYTTTESTDTLEELFNKTFHIQAICFLDIGYVLFGEDYKRGEFLVHMKKEQAIVEHDCGEELPDNLANVLTLLTKTKDEKFLNELAVRILIPALKKMLEEFDAARLEMKDRILKKKHKVLIQEDIENRNIYNHALNALVLVIEKDFAGITYEPTLVKPEIGGVNFLTNCDSCATPEKTTTEPQLAN
ncbi:MAG: hypothetical protein GY816_04060 [Cytophagales bacterium]|nr:hypothetical protein [Cytophagales bacterium]